MLIAIVRARIELARDSKTERTAGAYEKRHFWWI